MKNEEMHHAMSAVVADMGRAAKGARAKRFASKLSKHKASPQADAPIDPVTEQHEMDPNEMAELENSIAR